MAYDLQTFAQLSELMDRWHVPGLAIVIACGNDQAFHSEGFSNVESGALFTMETTIPIGSIGKPMVAHLVQHSVQNSDMHWDTPASRYLRGVTFPDERIQSGATLCDFLAMRTGLDGGSEWASVAHLGVAALAEVVSSLAIIAPFRERFIYSGMNTAVACLAMQNTFGQPWQELLRDHFTSLGIGSPSLCYRDALACSNAALGYGWNGDSFHVQAWPENEQTLVDPSVSLCLSLADLMRWLVAVTDGKCQGRPFQPHVLTRFPDVPLDFWPESYGLGWGLRTYRGHRMIYHRGSEWGFRTIATVIPDASIKLVITANRHSTLLIHLVQNMILDELLGHSSIPWEPLFETYSKQTQRC